MLNQIYMPLFVINVVTMRRLVLFCVAFVDGLVLFHSWCVTEQSLERFFGFISSVVLSGFVFTLIHCELLKNVNSVCLVSSESVPRLHTRHFADERFLTSRLLSLQLFLTILR